MLRTTKSRAVTAYLVASLTFSALAGWLTSGESYGFWIGFGLATATCWIGLPLLLFSIDVVIDWIEGGEGGLRRRP